MDRKYSGLDDLLKHNSQANDFFMSLPDYVQGTIRERGDRIDSEDDLHRYADNLVRNE